MEIKLAFHIDKTVQRPIFCALVSLLLVISCLVAQPVVKQYSVRNGRMYIELAKQIPEPSLDSFIAQYDLSDLQLKRFIRSNRADTLVSLGWKLEKNNAESFIISKSLAGYDDINRPGEKIVFTEKHLNDAALFPRVSNLVSVGYNRFRNGTPFASNDSMLSFFLPGYEKAGRVILSGSFSNWSTDALNMIHTDSGWLRQVKLGPGKYWYKFIIDGNWMVDKNNQLSENDGRGNINSVFYKTNYRIRLDSFTNAKKVFIAGSFNQWRSREIQLERTGTGWAIPLYLADGTHTYRFIVDDKWMADPFNTDRLPNEFGESNSVIRIGKPYLFSLDGYTNAKKVILSGSFNDWRRDELFMKKTATGWELPYTLGPGNYEYSFLVDGKWMAGEQNNLKFIIQPNFMFRLKGFDQAKTVYLAGDFNNWSPNSFAMKKEGNEWTLAMHLSTGKHLYKFIVDGKWIIDPANKLWEQNEQNTGNSVIWVESGE